MSDPQVTTSVQRRSGLARWRWPLIIGGPLVILLIVVFVILTGGKSVSTDNAYVQIAKVPVAPSIGGRVTQVLVHENQYVKAGQVLFRLDSRDYQASAQAAEAQLAQAQLDVRASGAAYDQEAAGVTAAKDTLSYATKEATRQKQLVAAGVASRQQLDQAVHAVDQARQDLAVAQQKQAEALAKLGGSPNPNPDGHPAVLMARAQLERARLNITYTTVIAPSDGVVTRVEQAPVGSYVNASQTVFYLLSGAPWVEANFKEDQLAHMKVGQPVTIKVDAYPDKLKGHVTSFSPGTGSAFSALPAQNATGNWVKVVQRLPVRIAFDQPPPDMAGRSGLSANVTVDIRNKGGAGS